MFLLITKFLVNWPSIFRLFHYTTFRTVMVCLTSLLFCLFLGPWVINKLVKLKIGQSIRNDGPKSHLTKKGTPTMGGALVLFSILISVFLWADLTNKYIWLLLIVMLSIGTLGFCDDFYKIVYKNSKGVSAFAKMSCQSVIAIFVGIYLYFLNDNIPSIIIPFFKNINYPLGVIGFCILTYFVVVGTSNAVNLTDGLDGLATLPIILVCSGLSVFAYVSGHYEFANYLQLPYTSGVSEVMIFCGAICGSCLGFLWWNANPAQLFMGDVGSLSLGAVLGTIAVIIRQEIVLFIMGGVFVAEAVSVILQVGSYKLRKKRIFLMAPIHHHFEQKGWKENQVVVRFWIITIILVLIGLTTLKIR